MNFVIKVVQFIIWLSLSTNFTNAEPIYGGDMAGIKQIDPQGYINVLNDGRYPYIVHLAVGKAGHCGGSIIRPDAILTAKHCVAGNPLNSIKVLAGSYNFIPGWEDPSHEFAGARKVVMDDYVDIAVVFLNRTLPTQNNKFIKVIKMANENEKKIFTGRTARVSGWGRDESNKMNANLRYTTLKVVTNDECIQRRKAYYIIDPVPDHLLCLFGPTNRESTGPADSGGPAAVIRNENSANDILVGVISQTYKKNDQKIVRTEMGSTMVDVAVMRPWIDKQLKDDALSGEGNSFFFTGVSRHP